MNIYKTELFPYLEGDALVGNEYTLTIKGIGNEMMPDHKGRQEKKYTVQFKETEKSLVLNKTNAKMIAKQHGPETNDWVGKRITLYAKKVNAFGETHNAIRVRDGNGGTSAPPPESTEIDPEDTLEQLGFSE